MPDPTMPPLPPGANEPKRHSEQYGHAFLLAESLAGYDEGRAAAERGVPEDANPYESGHGRYGSWRRGHQSVANDHSAAKHSGDPAQEVGP